MNQLQSDILIIGGGLTGLLAAFVLSSTNKDIIIVDKNDFINISQNNNDFRTTAISEGSKLFFEEVGLWKHLVKYAEPINKIKVYDRNVSRKINFQNSTSKNYLGYVIKNILLKKILIKLIGLKKNIKILSNLSLKDIIFFNENIEAILYEKTIKTKLLIASDGKNSFVRNFLKTPTYKKKYKHQAMVINLQHSKNHYNIAYELFLKSGPLAILPAKSNSKFFYCSSIIWSNTNLFSYNLNQINQILLKDIIEEKINKHIGKIIKILDKQCFDLSAHLNTKFYSDRLIYIGDSAHSIHPIAGQGWNLGVRDIKNALSSVNEGIKLGLDIGCPFVCKKYHNLSFYDAYLLFQVTDKLNSIFLNEKIDMQILRQQGFSFIENNSKVKKFISNFAMGL